MALHSSLIKINLISFKVISLAPWLWLVSLYSFYFVAMMKLGHYPIPSLNDPKDLGLTPIYIFTLYSLLVFMLSVFIWLTNLSVGLYNSGVPKVYVLIYVLGLILGILQILIDPGSLFAWCLD